MHDLAGRPPDLSRNSLGLVWELSSPRNVFVGPISGPLMQLHDDSLSDRLSVIVPDLSGNCLGIVWELSSPENRILNFQNVVGRRSGERLAIAMTLRSATGLV